MLDFDSFLQVEYQTRATWMNLPGAVLQSHAFLV